MAASFPYPLDCWMGLQVMGTEVAAAGYARQPTTIVDVGDGVTGANAATVQWGVCGASWGAIDTVTLWDDAAAGNLISSGAAATIVQASLYDILRVSAGSYQVIRVMTPLGFGTLSWGTGRYATANTLAPAASGVPLLETFGAVALCGGEPGDWTPAGPYDVVVAA